MSYYAYCYSSNLLFLIDFYLLLHFYFYLFSSQVRGVFKSHAMLDFLIFLTVFASHMLRSCFWENVYLELYFPGWMNLSSLWRLTVPSPTLYLWAFYLILTRLPAVNVVMFCLDPPSGLTGLLPEHWKCYQVTASPISPLQELSSAEGSHRTQGHFLSLGTVYILWLVRAGL